MSFAPSLLNICNFLGNSTEKEQNIGLFRVTVVAFEDKCNLNCGLRFAEMLKKNSLFDVNYFNEPFAKSFLNLQSRNFFDFIDHGKKILENTHSDILIWGYEEEGKIRINFQIENQYVIPNKLSFSLLDSLFIPLSYFVNPDIFSESLQLLIYGIIVAAITPVTNNQKNSQATILKDIISLLASDTSKKDISREFMPFIMNLLGKIYLSDKQDNLKKEDIIVIQNLFETALKNKQFMRLPIYYGCIYNSLGQLFETAGRNATLRNKYTDFLRLAISNYKSAQRYLNKNYPYDNGLISYHLALLYFEYWKFNSDLQALRNAVSQLREAEKVYSLAQFPLSWYHIEGLLGYYLTSLGMRTNCTEIMQLAIECYKKQQKLKTQIDYPIEWSEVQAQIGDVLYLLGKQNNDDNFMLEAKNYYNSALDIYKTFKMKPETLDIEKRLKKVHNYID